jgi:hypothetical protein
VPDGSKLDRRFDGMRQTGENQTRRGPVAQLGARFHGMEEVIGSIPIRSTNSLPFQLLSYRLALLRRPLCIALV